MEVGGIGGGATHADALVNLAGSAKTAVPSSGFLASPSGQDSVAGLLEQLSLPQISSLIQGIENARHSVGVEPAGDLLAKAVAAIHDGDVPRALATLTDLVHAHPGRAETLPHEAVLAPIRTDVDRLIQRLTSVARADAEQKIDLAVSRMKTGGHGIAHRVELHPQTVIAAATRLLESGQYANIVLSASMAQAVIEFYGPFPAASASVRFNLEKETARATPSPLEGFSELGTRTIARAARMWREAPLLLMLIVWMLLGLFMGFLALALRELSPGTSLTRIFFDIWGIGFLGLIGFGFYRSIRRLRF